MIELVVVILLIGIITAIGLPRVLRAPIPVTQDFMHNLNTLISEARTQAQQEGEPRRIFFNLSGRTIEIQTAGGKKLRGSIEIPPTLDITDVVINGESQFQAGTGKTVYFLLNPEGISQEVMLYIEEKKGGETRSFEFYLNPFLSIFRVH